MRGRRKRGGRGSEGEGCALSFQRHGCSIAGAPRSAERPVDGLEHTLEEERRDDEKGVKNARTVSTNK